ncbi:hypothetical protein [Aulosira sp. FACHB-615]|uniref:hypothetical protein n=1 Tax=Aulosira sp. FACHB-615 TaxID=2692777 RepID=UPI001685EC8F|nr:hypothetical protein [Aulosira sp. FACHB-615]MBD2491994.1 hypothetical protein [Aulosira sp. FACHB-615]
MINSHNTSTTGHIHIGSSSLIDFAVWVLLIDGLHVHPFDKHSGGNQILQNQGMNIKSWYDWLKLILIAHDNRLFWHVPNIHEAAQASVKSFQELLELNSQIHNVICDEEWQNEQQQYYLEQLSQQEQCYQEALADYLSLNINSIRESTPPQLWVGEQAIQGVLIQLWDEYQALKYSNSFINDILQTPRLWSIESNLPINKYREIYLVDYPFEVEIFVKPIFCIVTVPNIPINQEKLESRMKRVIEHS